MSVNESVKIFVDRSPLTQKLGAVNSLWTQGVAETLGIKENVVCDAYLAPLNFLDSPEGIILKEGLEIDRGREEDCDMVRISNRAYV